MRQNGRLPERLNLGCGPVAPSGWLNVDGSWNAWFASHGHVRSALEAVGIINTNQGTQWRVAPLVHDLTKPLPFRDNTFSAIYASHVLEHLYRDEAQRLLLECKRVLRSDGVIRLVVPDLHSMVAAYLKGRDQMDTPTLESLATTADRLNERLGFRSPEPRSGNVFYRLYSAWKDFHVHKWMYDVDSLRHYAELAGFREVSEKQFLQSAIEGIEEVEDPHRLLDGAGVCVEGRK
jgi:predicted SAM-dependent methyltransferase